MSVWVQLVACFCAALAFSCLMNQPKSTMLVSSLIAAAGYALYLLLDRGVLAYFLVTVMIGFGCELYARIMKRTATLFVTGAIVPLVPGIGLYNTMLYVVDGDYYNAVNTGAATVLGICGIALAITMSSVLFSAFGHSEKKKEKPC